MGLSYRKRVTLDGVSEQRSQTYVLLPQSLQTLESFTVTRTNGAVTTKAESNGLFVPLVMFGLSIGAFLVAWYWPGQRGPLPRRRQ